MDCNTFCMLIQLLAILTQISEFGTLWRRQILAEVEASSALCGIFLLKGILLFLAFVFFLGFTLEWHKEVSASTAYSLNCLVCGDRN